MKSYIVTKLVRHEERVWATDIKAAQAHVERLMGRDWRVDDRVKLVSIVEERDELPVQAA